MLWLFVLSSTLEYKLMPKKLPSLVIHGLVHDLVGVGGADRGEEIPVCPLPSGFVPGVVNCLYVVDQLRYEFVHF